MVDDFRHPRTNNQNDEDQNKQLNIESSPMPALEASHIYDGENSFAATQAEQKLKKRRLPQFLIFKHASPKQKLVGGILITVVLVSGSGGVYALHKNFNKNQLRPAAAVTTKAPPPQPATEASRLSGVQISPELNKRPVVSVQIENSPDARPQAGLIDAGVIYEAIAEGGITRFNVSFLEGQPDHIGPVRSVRPYYAALSAPFDPVFVHAGGSADGLAKIRELGLKDMDHGANGAAFKRVSDRYAPHNLYTSMSALDAASQKRGYSSSDVKSFQRKADKPGQSVTARTIDLAISSAQYNVHYDYDQASNSYKRVMGGKPHTDHKSGQQLAPKVVIALVMSYSQKGIYSVYQTSGSGKLYVFQDGGVQQGSWSKAGDKEQFVLTDDVGKPLPINAGQTWISLVKTPANVSFAP